MMLYIIPYLFYSLLSLCGIFLQAEVFSFLTIFGVKPDLLLIIAVMAGLHSGNKNGAAAGAVVGLWADLLAGGFFGVHILVYALIGYIFGSIKNKTMFKSYPGYFFIVLLAGLASGALFIIAYVLVGANYSFWQSFTAIVVPYTFYDCLLIVLAFPFIFLYRRFRGLKIGYVDMFGGGIILITNNEKVDMDYVRKRKAQKGAAKEKQRRKESKQHRSKRERDPEIESAKKVRHKQRGNKRRIDYEHEDFAEYEEIKDAGTSPFHNEGYYGPDIYSEKSYRNTAPKNNRDNDAEIKTNRKKEKYKGNNKNSKNPKKRSRGRDR